MLQDVQKKIVTRFYKERIRNQQNEFVHPSYRVEQKLLNAIKLGNEAEAIQAITDINSRERAKLSHNSLRSLKNSVICSCTLFTRAAIEGGLDAESAYNMSDVLIQEIEQLDDLKAVEEFEVSMVYTFIQSLKDNMTPHYSAIIKNTISYIHEHILEDLTLDIIAEQLFINPSYLSSTFKKKTGTTLMSYINQKKIEESKYFLLHSELSISDISALFHFCNQSYYTSLFKRATGLTPRQFRELETVI